MKHKKITKTSTKCAYTNIVNENHLRKKFIDSTNTSFAGSLLIGFSIIVLQQIEA